jgi:predicted lipoprotein with Yx(FWY)xxD motif
MENVHAANSPVREDKGRRNPARRLALGISGLFVIGTIAAACGSSGSATTTTTGGGGGATTGALVSTTHNSTLGTILVNSQGFTLYHFTTDTRNHSNCTGSCLGTWAPLIMKGSGSPVGGSGVTGLSTFKSPSGRQVSYNGEPLYVYSGDTAAGQTNGQDLEGTWFVVTTKAATTTTTGGGSTTTTGGGGGYGY